MKRLFTLLAIVAVAGFTFSCGSNATKKNDGAVENVDDGAVKKAEAPKRQGYDDNYSLPSSTHPLYGDVESVVIKDYYIEEEKSDFVKAVRGEFAKLTFNVGGDLIMSISYTNDYQYRCKYDSAGNMIEAGLSSGYSDMINRTLFRYDSEGRMVEEAFYNIYGEGGSDRDYKCLYKYDSAGNKIERVEYDSDGSLDSKTLYKYDSAGRIIEEADYEADGSLSGKWLNKYNFAGNMIERTRYKSNGSINKQFLYEYDFAGNMIERAKTLNGRFGAKHRYKYDSKGNMIEDASYNEDGSLYRKRLYKYDSRGNVVEEQHFEGENLRPTNLIEYEIVYR